MYCKALSGCPYGAHLNFASVKQIGIFRKKMHDIRGKAATDDALRLEMSLGITTNTHLQEVSSASGWVKDTLEWREYFYLLSLPIQTKLNRFSPSGIFLQPHLTGDLFCEINYLKINRIRRIFSLWALQFPWDVSDSIFIACVGVATTLTASVNGGDIKVGCVVPLFL